MKAKHVIRIGQRALPKRFEGAATALRPQVSVSQANSTIKQANSTIKMAILTRQTDQHEQCDLGLVARSRKTSSTQIGQTMTTVLPTIADAIVWRKDRKKEVAAGKIRAHRVRCLQQGLKGRSDLSRIRE